MNREKGQQALTKQNNASQTAANPQEKLLECLVFLETMTRQQMSTPERAYWAMCLSGQPVETVMKAAKTWVRENPYLPKLSEFETLIEDLRRETARQQSYRMLEERREPTDEDRKNLKEFLDGAKELARKKAMPKA